jgi:hypothetical protein
MHSNRIGHEIASDLTDEDKNKGLEKRPLPLVTAQFGRFLWVRPGIFKGGMRLAQRSYGV